MNIEQIKADREAGTQGPWVYEYTCIGHTVRQPGHMLSILKLNHAGNPECDARRIARVPDLEDGLIEAMGYTRLLLGSFTVDERITAQDFLKKYTKPD